MRRFLKVAAAGLLTLLVVLGGLIYWTFGGKPPLIDGTALGPAQLVKDGYVAVWMVDTSDGVLLVDGGNDPEAAAIRAELERRGKVPGDVRHILLTHGHPDHISGIPRFPNATVYALQSEVALVEGKVGAKGPITRFFAPKDLGVRVTRVVKDGETLEIGGHTIEVYAVPGHTAGSAAWMLDGYLFLGDSGDSTTDGTISDAVWPFTDDADQNHASLVALSARLKGREVKGAGFAHSGALTGGGALQAID